MVKLNLRNAFGPFTIQELAQRCFAEALGTFILVLVGCMGVGINTMNANSPDLNFVAGFNFGLAVMIAVLMVGHISGSHVNPAVTLTFVIMKVVTPALAVLYIVFQCLGAIIGYGVLYGLTPSFRRSNSAVCVTRVHNDLTAWEGMAWEAISTAILCFVVCTVIDKRNADKTDSTPLKLGFVVSCLAVVEAPYTNCSLNPARSLGPALWTWQWKDQWVYWIGPLLGSAVASCTYRFLLYIPNEKNPNQITQPELEAQSQDEKYDDDQG